MYEDISLYDEDGTYHAVSETAEGVGETPAEALKPWSRESSRESE